ncbi:uncharacterized protein DEA37_0010863 [Paragonimus westermani]|uniref:Reverse transcriptase domain-containing protein n=1 Tax=Paragonimus westermani TaxID=34504 RepID=A0A5J4N781_9TREM|nr:uncharacterized protein DEA37_0010863 [Paragonimus westermani]
MSKAYDRINQMDRVIQVRVDGASSKPVAVKSGVPQGWVIRPTLFLIYANDIANLVRCKIVLFADDIKLWASISPSKGCVLLQEDLNALYDRSLRNKLPFNFQK